MKGLKTVSANDASVIILESVSDEIRAALKLRLSEYCYGRVKAGEDPDYYSFDLTVDEFFKLYDTKPDKTRLGLAGELISHLLIPHSHEQLESACVYLNKEEQNVKKGFDLTFRDRDDGGLWYGEVKTGRVRKSITADKKVRELVSTAEHGLHAMFTSDVRRKRWDAAIFDADSALQSSDASSVKSLLRADFKTVNAGYAVKVNALLCAVVMHPLDLSQISSDMGAELIESVSGRARFDRLRLLLIQQADLEVLVSVLRDSLKESI